MPGIAVCADDYGIAPGVSRAIADLAAAGRISAASAMTVWPGWPREGRAIHDTPLTTEWGLHITLTDAPTLGPMERLAPAGRTPSLPRLVALAQSVGLPQGELQAEIGRQLDAFEAAVGTQPAFVDGHQHVHVLPGVREAVLALFGPRLDPARTWIRVCTSRPAAIVARGVARRRSLLIDRLSRPLARQVQKRKLGANADFRGVTDFRPDRVSQEFAAWLTAPCARTLIMCHPGSVDDTLAARDPVLARREAEHRYLSGPRFAEALAATGLRVGPLHAGDNHAEGQCAG